MADISLPWGGSFAVDESGDIAMVTGKDEATQRLLRRFLTTSGQGLPDGTQTQPEYIWDSKYGGNARAAVDRNVDEQLTQELQLLLMEQAQQEADIAPAPPPSIKLTKLRNGLLLSGQIWLRSGGVAPIPDTEVIS